VLFCNIPKPAKTFVLSKSLLAQTVPAGLCVCPVCVFVCGGNSFMFAVKSCRDFTYLSGRRPRPLYSHSSYHSALLLAGHFQFLFILPFSFSLFGIFSSFSFFLPSNQRAIKSHKQDEASGCCVMVFIVSVNGFCKRLPLAHF